MKFKRSSYHLDYYHILIFIISHLWSGTDGEWLPGYSINAPRRVTVQRGLCVFIPCSFTVPETVTLTRNATGIWFRAKNGLIVASNINSIYGKNGRFFLVGDVQRRECNLYIEDPLYSDEGRYLFRVEDNIKFTYQDIQPYVDVTDLESKPEISPIKSWLDGEEVTLSCTSPGTCLRITPQITWEGNIQNRSVENQVTNHKNGTTTHSSTITFTARKEQNNSTLECIVPLKGGLTTRQQIILKVEYKPRIVNERNSSCQTVENRFKCICLIQSFPIPTVKWKINGESINTSSDMNVDISTETSDSVTNSTMTLGVNMEETQNISCVASNVHGKLVQELFTAMARSKTKAFPAAAIFGGCFAAVFIVTGVFLIMFYRKKKMTQNKETPRQTHVSVTDPIYGNSEVFSNGLHEAGKIPQRDQPPSPEAESVYQDCQDVQYMTVNFSKLKPNMAKDEEEVEYSVIKQIN